MVNRDITERKRAAEALRRSEASFRTVVEDAPYGIFRASLTGKFLMVNPALEQMLDYKSQDELLKVNLASDICRHTAGHQKLSETILQGHNFKDIEVEWRSEERRVGKECRSRWSP